MNERKLTLTLFPGEEVRSHSHVEPGAYAPVEKPGDEKYPSADQYSPPHCSVSVEYVAKKPDRCVLKVDLLASRSTLIFHPDEIRVGGRRVPQYFGVLADGWPS